MNKLTKETLSLMKKRFPDNLIERDSELISKDLEKINEIIHILNDLKLDISFREFCERLNKKNRINFKKDWDFFGEDNYVSDGVYADETWSTEKSTIDLLWQMSGNKSKLNKLQKSIYEIGLENIAKIFSENYETHFEQLFHIIEINKLDPMINKDLEEAIWIHEDSLTYLD